MNVFSFFTELKRGNIYKPGAKKHCAAGIQVLLVVQFRIIKSHDHNHL